MAHLLHRLQYSRDGGNDARGVHSVRAREIICVNNMADERDLENMHKLEKLKDIRYAVCVNQRWPPLIP